MAIPKIYGAFVKKLPVSGKSKNWLLKNSVLVVIILIIGGFVFFSFKNNDSNDINQCQNVADKFAAIELNSNYDIECYCYTPTKSEWESGVYYNTLPRGVFISCYGLIYGENPSSDKINRGPDIDYLEDKLEEEGITTCQTVTDNFDWKVVTCSLK